MTLEPSKGQKYEEEMQIQRNPLYSEPTTTEPPDDDENDELRRQEIILAFSDKSIRRAFIRKVYSILTVQLILVSLIVVMIYSIAEIRNYVLENPRIVSYTAIFSLLIVFILSCCRSVARSFPINYIFLFVFTLAEGIFLGAFCIYYNPEVILFALGITLLICFLLTVFAFQTSIDFTGLGLCLCLIIFVFLAVSICFMIIQPSKPFQMALSAGLVLFYSFLLIYDTQLMLGGNHQYAIMPEDYIFAVLALYLDIANIFVNVLQLLAGGQPR